MAIDDITPLPEPPVRGDAEDQFVTKANAFLGALVPFQGQLNTFAGQANNLADAWESTIDQAAIGAAASATQQAGAFADAAEGHADDAEASANLSQAGAVTAQNAAGSAVSAGNYKGDWIDLAGSLSAPASVSHEGYIWALTSNVADVTANEPGTSGVWAKITPIAPNLLTALPDITSLSSLNTAALADGQQFYRGEFWPDTGVGAVNIKWKPDEPVASHNGGTIIDPAKISELDTVNKTFGTYFIPDTVSGNTGCFVVDVGSTLTPEIFGVMETTGTEALQAALYASAGINLCAGGHYRVSKPLVMPANGVSIFGGGRFYSSSDAESGGFDVGVSLFNCQGCVDYHFKGVTLDTSTIEEFASATRAITNNECSRFSITHCTFIVSGAATIATRSSYYDVSHNNIRVEAADGVAHHDGVIDQWWGSSKFTVSHNIVEGNGIARYPILVTGTSTGTPETSEGAGCSDFSISDNIIMDCVRPGIWVNGRKGGHSRFAIANNTVVNSEISFGIGVSDAANFTVSGNVISNTAVCGIRLYQESTAAENMGVQNFVCSGNSIENANGSLSSSENLGSSISVEGANSISGIVIGNTSSGDNHRRAVVISAGAQRITEASTVDRGANFSPVVADFSGGDRNNRLSSGIYNAETTAVSLYDGGSIRINYSVNGVEATCYFRASLTSTASGTVEVRCSLPVLSDLAGENDVIGYGVDMFGNTCVVRSDVTNNDALFTFQASSAATYVFRGSFSFIIR